MSPTKKNQNEDDEKMAKQLVEAYEKIREQVHQVIVGQDKVLGHPNRHACSWPLSFRRCS